MNWHEALKFAVKEYDGKESDWGEADCCQFVNTYWFNLTGENFGAGASVQYQNQTGALKILSKHGGMQGLLTHFLGESHTDPDPGDVVLLELGEDVYAPGVYTGYCVFSLMPEDGLVRMPESYIKEAWCPRA